MLEPGTGHALEIPAGLIDFHEVELVEYGEDSLAIEAFNTWSIQPAVDLPLPRNSCAGYSVPLFLGGRDEIENMELVDLEVYWALCGELRLGIKDYAKGSSITNISITK